MRATRFLVLASALSSLATSADTLGAQRAPAKVEPWSVRMARSVVKRSPVVMERWDYTAGLMLLAIDRVADARHDAALERYVRENMDRFVKSDGSIATYRVEEFNLDQINQGRLLFALARKTGDARYMKAANLLHAQLAHQPRTKEGGFWHKQIYPSQMWLDGLYMAEPFYAEFAAKRRDRAMLDDVARQFLLAARQTRDARTGLLYHAWDESHSQGWADPATGLSKNFWGRADGWYLMALVDVLDHLPADHPDRGALIRLLQQGAEAVARVQDPVSGLWYQVLDQPSRTGNYLEASASSMFVYAFAKGVRRGYLDPRYRDIAERGFNGLVTRLVTVESDGTVSLQGICRVAGLGGTPPRDGSFEYYVREPVVANDFKGVGPFVMAALELGR